MVIKGGKEIYDTYKADMLLGNSVKGLLKTSVREINNEIFLYYEVSSRQMVQVEFDKAPIGNKELRKLLTSLYTCIQSIREYLLDINDILLEPEMIFWNREENTFEFCYYPNREGEFGQDFNDFLQYLLKKINHMDQEAVILAYELQNICLKERNAIIGGLEKAVKGERNFQNNERKQVENYEELNIIYDKELKPDLKPELKSNRNAIINIGGILFGMAFVVSVFIFSGFLHKKYGFISLAAIMGILLFISYKKIYENFEYFNEIKNSFMQKKEKEKEKNAFWKEKKKEKEED